MNSNKYFLLLPTSIFLFFSCTSQQSFNQLSNSEQALVQSCLACHSQGEKMGAPRLEGLQSWYLREQVIKFKEGIRGAKELDSPQTKTMHLAVKNINEDDLITATNYFSTQKRPEIKITLKAEQPDIHAGQELYKENCQFCHSNSFGGFVTHSPKLSQIEDWYFIKQCENFATGLRGHQGDNDHGQAMGEKIKRVAHDDFTKLANYLNSLKN